MFTSKTYNNHTLSVAFNWQGFKVEIISTWSSSNISTILSELLPVELREDAILTNIKGLKIHFVFVTSLHSNHNIGNLLKVSKCYF